MHADYTMHWTPDHSFRVSPACLHQKHNSAHLREKRARGG